MDDIRSLILKTYQERPKHFTQILKRNPEVLKCIEDFVPKNITSFTEQLYYVAFQDDGVCKNGQKKKLKSFAGYSFCGKTGQCQCAKESVGASVSAKKQAMDSASKELVQVRRRSTVLSRYGVDNVGLTDTAKEGRNRFYADDTLIKDLSEQIKSTKEIRYGSGTYNNSQKRIETCKERYGVDNTFLLTSDNSNPGVAVLKDKARLSDLYPRLSVSEISDMLGVVESTVYKYLGIHSFREPYKSTFEKEIVYFLNELGVDNIITNSRKIISKELDIFLPDYNLAIEYNGIYWHHDKVPHISRDYHMRKFRECEEKGIELFTIFSNSWDEQKDIWKSKIKSKLNLSDKRIYARKTQVVIPTTNQVKTLLRNHVQGYTVSEIQYGLEYDGDIVAVMTFSKKRMGIGRGRSESSYELVRYCTSATVIGGASKLLKRFIKDYSPEEIVSYSDNRYSVGNLYKTLGFELESDNKPGFSYYDPAKKTMLHRLNYTKFKLVQQGYDKDKTAFQITDELGLLRIWDCGTRTWTLRLKY